MQYELTIQDALEKPGAISLRRLSHITRSITRVAEGALQLQLRGISYVQGRPSKEALGLEAAVEMNLVGLGKKGNVLMIECATLEDTLPNVQLDAFRQADQIALTKKTPMGLFIETYHRALDGGGAAKDLLDKGLLNELRGIRHAFRDPKERMIIQNQGSVPPLELDQADLKRIRSMEVAIPAPVLTVVNGKVDMFRHSKALIEIHTADGKRVEGFLNPSLHTDQVRPYLGEEVTVKGLLHRRAGGKEIVEVQQLFAPSEGDRFFSRKPEVNTVQEQIAEYRRRSRTTNPLPDIKGKWPGDEDLETILRMLKG